MERFTVGQEIANFLISCGILSKAWEESDVARDSESFNLTEHEGVTYVTFPSFHKIEGFIVDEGEYGLGNILTNNQIFSERGNDGKPALVHQGALKLFLLIMEKTDFQAKLQVYTDSKQRDLKPIIFVGHSLGGAVATLATLWVLQKRLRQSSPFCITFGCPLVGNETLAEAVGRENWGGKFLHVISQHDIVPRMLLAPLKSIAQPLTAILPYWHGQIRYSFIQDACNTLLENVMQCTYTVENYGADSFSRLDEVIQNAGNTLLKNDVDSSAGSDGAIKRSPYKPFGIYLFCSSNGAACIDNSETVLNMLHLTMPSRENLSDYMVQECISEHIAYGSVLKHVTENSVSGRIIDNSNSESAYEMGISMQLDALDVRCQNGHKWIFSPITGDMENRLDENAAKLRRELVWKKCTMAELEWYKESCEKNEGITYCDSFKNQGDRKDIDASLRRRILVEFWDEIVEMWESHELPSDFETQDKWINAGNTYRRLVEPLDIAYYYRVCRGNANYLSDGRPRRHKVLQEWMEAKEKTGSSRVQGRRTKPASLTQDSCFWAHVEEAWKDLESLKQGQHQSLQNVKKFEEYVTNMVKALSISSNVFVEQSSFMEWWKEWKEYNKNHWPRWSSPLYEIMEHENPFKFERIEWYMERLEWYKESFEKQDGITYYDSFRKLEDRKDKKARKDKNANLPRTNLADLWDELIETWESHELPSDLETLNKWINAGTRYRRLVEPLDIAHYYRTNSFGNYLSDGRPKRHKLLQKWMEGKENTGSSRVQGRHTKPASLTQDSCFWAHVEEALKDLESLKQGKKHRLQNLENFEKYVTQMVKALSISSDVLWEGSSFMNWWKKWKEYNKAQSPEWSSPLYQIMESESPLKFEGIDSLTGRQENISSTGEAKDSIPSNKEVTESIPSNKEVNDSIPSNKEVKESIPSNKEVNDSIPSNKEVKESVPSNKEVNDSIPSNKEGKDSIPSNMESDLAQLSSKESELIPQQGRMFELEWYKMICHEKGDGYYDSFKIPNDSKTNLLRVTLNEFWDGIIEICNSPSLPSAFQSRNKWINVGTAYRKLVEPLDIAQYYSTSKDSGNYLDKRHARYKVLEQWLEHRKTNRSSRDQRSRTKLPFLTRDSCFWARVEEALKDLKEGADQKKESLENFEKYVTEMIKDCKISSDVFLEGSSFMKWWRDYKEHQTSEWKLKSPLYNLKSPFWKP